MNNIFQEISQCIGGIGPGEVPIITAVQRTRQMDSKTITFVLRSWVYDSLRVDKDFSNLNGVQHRQLELNSDYIISNGRFIKNRDGQTNRKVLKGELLYILSNADFKIITVRNPDAYRSFPKIPRVC